MLLPRGSQPHGIVFDSAGSSYYVVLEALATLEKRAAGDDTLQASLALGGHPRHLSMRYDDFQQVEQPELGLFAE